MTRIEVSPDQGRWRVSVDFGAQGYNEYFLIKWFAVAYARRTALAHASPASPVSLRIKNRRGRYQEERTYPRSADPSRTPG